MVFLISYIKFVGDLNFFQCIKNQLHIKIQNFLFFKCIYLSSGIGSYCYQSFYMSTRSISFR